LTLFNEEINLTFEPAQTCDFTRKSIAMDEMILLRDQRLLVKDGLVVHLIREHSAEDILRIMKDHNQ